MFFFELMNKVFKKSKNKKKIKKKIIRDEVNTVMCLWLAFAKYILVHHDKISAFSSLSPTSGSSIVKSKCVHADGTLVLRNPSIFSLKEIISFSLHNQLKMKSLMCIRASFVLGSL